MKPWGVILALGMAVAPLTVIHPARISGHSMEPTLRSGQVVWVLRAWAAGSPKRGQVWVVQAPEGVSVKRVLALPGERVELKDGLLRAGGRELEEPYVARLDRGSSGHLEAGDGYLVFGDNRPESRDSRVWGAVPGKAFRGRVLDLD